jgi:hypothetical protein
MLSAEDLLQDATALVKPELFSHLSAREDKPMGMIKNFGAGTVSVRNTRNGTVSEITLIDVPAGSVLQPNTLYLNSRGADSIGLTGKSCFVDISNRDMAAADTVVEIDSTDPVDSINGDILEEDIPVEDIAELPDNGLTDPADSVYGSGIVLGFSDLDYGETSGSMAADIINTEKDNTIKDDNEGVFADDDQLLTEETMDSADMVTVDLVEDDAFPEDTMEDGDVIYFLEPSDFRPPSNDLLSDVEATEQKDTLVSITLPPLKEGSAPSDFTEAGDRSTLERGFYVQVGIYSEKESLVAAQKVLCPYDYPQKEVQFAGKSGAAVTKLILGPFKKDEIGVVLYKVRHSGYNDAFIIEIPR